ncbi:unnamed protein product [Spirodela intermedia]|uniref:Uncharacterized protein n=1 Tax=Spirodela intermedia TaxID=51605 RepID=A0A7I8KKZ2_SPIIN|nr:unnamed protein product [Spirodela intermedia]
MGTTVRLVQAREVGLLLGSPFPSSGGPGGAATTGRRTVAFAAGGNNQNGGGSISSERGPSSSPSTEQQKEKKKGKLGAQRPRGPSVLEVQRAIGIADGDDGGAAR